MQIVIEEGDFIFVGVYVKMENNLKCALNR